MIVVYQSFANPDMGFALDFPKEHYEEGKILAGIGWNAWWCATHPDDWDYEDIMSKEEVEYCYWDGYMEPAIELLNEANIPYTQINCHDENGDFDAEMITEYEDWI